MKNQTHGASAAHVLKSVFSMSTPITPVAQDAASVRRATLIGLVAVLCWSSTVGLIRSVSEALGALGGAAMLYSVSAVLLFAVQGVPRMAQLRSVSKVYLLGCGALFALYEVCLSVAIGLAQDRAQSMELGMINYLWPCLTIVLAVLCRQQRARWWLWPGVALCIWGLVCVLGGDGDPAMPWWQALAAHMYSNPLAYALAFAAALLWPVYSVLSRMHGGGFNGVGLFVLLTAVVLWAQWLAVDTVPMRWSWGVALEVLAIGAGTAIGYSCWEHGIQRGNLAVMAAGSYFAPVLSALWASIWLAVQPGWPFWQGVALVPLGSLLCWHATQR
jgi:drug/metabolite transporter (DMT)-like permease